MQVTVRKKDALEGAAADAAAPEEAGSLHRSWAFVTFRQPEPAAAAAAAGPTIEMQAAGMMVQLSVKMASPIEELENPGAQTRHVCSNHLMKPITGTGEECVLFQIALTVVERWWALQRPASWQRSGSSSARECGGVSALRNARWCSKSKRRLPSGG